MSEPGLPRPRARLLDLTRLVSRAGRGRWTGIDRVEAAYLNACLNDPLTLFSLVRTALGFVLLDRQGTAGVNARLHGHTPWGRPDLIASAWHRTNPARARAEADLRRLSLARTRPGGLAAMLARHLPPGTAWLNVGHTNLDPPVFAAVHALADGRAHVLVHDTIPLDFPDYQRPGSVESFARRLQSVSQHADLVIYNSAATRHDAERHFSGFGRVPEGLVAHLGVETPRPDPDALAPGLDLAEPYFVTVGTIEPRKNHALLLDTWDALTGESKPPPHLFIVGARGWNNEAVFARLDDLPDGVTELNGLSDGAMSALLAGARAALFPSLAEGFGLPAAEAAALGVPVVVNDLPVYREVLGDIPVYADAMDMYSWRKIIREMAEKPEAEQTATRKAKRTGKVPTWHDHFNLVLKVS